MAPKAERPQEAAPKGAVERPEWMARQGARLESQRAALTSSSPPSVEAFAGAATMAPDAFRPAPQSALLEARAEPMRGADAACRLLHRRTDEGLLKTGFEPQRHSVIVAGRPTQVPTRRTMILLESIFK